MPVKRLPTDEPPFKLRLHWPPAPPLPWREDFFWGVWHASRPIELTLGLPPAGILPEAIRGRNWALVSNRLSASTSSLAHLDQSRTNEALAFRGYVLEPPIHSWSDPTHLIDYWSGGSPRHNGVFAVGRVVDRGATLHLTSDAFGIAPLYWRQLHGGLIIFCTSARYLRVADDTLSPYAERLFMHRRALAGNVSLLQGVERLAPGTTLTATAEGTVMTPWFDWNSLPPGDEPMSDDHLTNAERTFQTAVDRCSALMPDALAHLPLSSGDDSRRILAALHARGSKFHALTVRVLQKNNRDLDGRFATDLATRIGFDHEVLELADSTQFGEDDAACRMLMSSEVSEHSWVGPLVRALPRGLSLVFDGLAGDVFGNTGFGLKELYSFGSEDLAEVARLATPVAISDVLRPRVWQPLALVRERLAADLQFLPENANRPDLAFLMIRVRRGTAPCMQQLLPPGHVSVCPYLDLDHAIATLSVNPIVKLDQTLQARCLARYWPKYFSIPGSRRFPLDVPNESSIAAEARQASRMAHLASEAPSRGITQAFHKIRFRNASLATLGMVSKTLTRRSEWWLDPLLMLEGFRSQAVVCEIE